MPYKKPHYGGSRPSTFRPGGVKPAVVRGQRPVRQKAEDELNINEEITASQVRLVGDNIAEPGIYPTKKIKKMPRSVNSVASRARRKKRAKEMKANAAKIVIKEIRFGPNTDEHDFQFKLKHAREFLEEGSKVKATIFFRGRSIMFADQGEKQLLRFAVELEEYGRAENMPTLEGKRMTMMIAPLKKKQ